MKKLLLTLGAGIMMLSGCSSDEPTFNETPKVPSQSDWEVTSMLQLTQTDISTVAGFNSFGDDLISAVAAQSAGGDFCVSPLSASIYLSLLANSAEGDARTQIINLLGADDIDNLNSLSSKLLHYLPCEETGAKLLINNGVWLANRYTASTSYTDAMADVFNTNVTAADFSQQSTFESINDWVSTNTEGLIKSFYDISRWQEYSNLDMTSINTVYFLGKWYEDFDPDMTDKADFATPLGKKTVDMMHLNKTLMYAANDKAQLVKLYYEGTRDVMELYLPKAGTDAGEIASVISADVRNSLIGDATKCDVTLSIPRFECEYTKELSDILVDMGVPALNNVLLTPMGIGNIQKVNILQKTAIKVNEKGTEMAAVTGGWAETTPDQPEVKEITLTFDRPFMFVVRNCDTDAILMAGVVTRP